MKVKEKESRMDIDDALDALHLSNPQKKKRRRLSGITKGFTSLLDASELSIPSTSEAADDMNEEKETTVRRTSRRKSIPVRWNPESNVTKQKVLDSSNQKEIEKYYLDKSVKKGPTSLETIFEVESNDDISSKLMSNKKFRRFLQFNKVTKGKIKKRKENANKISNRKKKTIKASLSDLHKRLALLEEEDC